MPSTNASRPASPRGGGSRRMPSRRWPRAASGSGPRPSGSGWSTSWAASSRHAPRRPACSSCRAARFRISSATRNRPRPSTGCASSSTSHPSRASLPSWPSGTGRCCPAPPRSRCPASAEFSRYRIYSLEAVSGQAPPGFVRQFGVGGIGPGGECRIPAGQGAQTNPAERRTNPRNGTFAGFVRRFLRFVRRFAGFVRPPLSRVPRQQPRTVAESAPSRTLMSRNPRQSGLSCRVQCDRSGSGVAYSATVAGSVGSFAGRKAAFRRMTGFGHDGGTAVSASAWR